MLIMPSLKMIFVHLTKCGGTSVEVAFDRICKWNDIVIGGTDFGEILQPHYSAKFGLDKHSTAKDIARVIGDASWKQFYSWALVRNPFGRMLSSYSHIRREVSFYLNKVAPEITSPKEIADWAHHKDFPERKVGWPWGHPAIQAYLATLNEDNPFSAFLRHPLFMHSNWNWPLKVQLEDETGQHLAINKFIKLEDLGNEWPKLCQKLGVPDLELPWENASQVKDRAHASPKLTWREEDIVLIQERFAVDFETFGYGDRPPQ
jgi:hypothetical protein